MNLSDTVVSIIRTVIPAAWGSLIAYLLSLFPAIAIIEVQSLEMGQTITLVVIGLWYSVTRALEPRLPEWLRTLFFGVTSAPDYDKE